MERGRAIPFFVEELVGTLIDQGFFNARTRWTVRDPAQDLVVPDTVQALLAARIDRLAAP